LLIPPSTNCASICANQMLGSPFQNGGVFIATRLTFVFVVEFAGFGWFAISVLYGCRRKSQNCAGYE